MTKKLQLAIDADDVLVNFGGSLVSQYNQEYGKSVTVEELLTTWNLNENVEEGEDLYEIMNRPGMFRNLKAFDDVVDGLNALIEAGHEVIISTAGNRNAYNDKYENFKELFPMIPEEQILMIKRKDLLYLDVMIDDGPHNIIASNCKVNIIMDRPWNRFLSGIRVYSFAEACQVVEDYANGLDLTKYWKEAVDVVNT